MSDQKPERVEVPSGEVQFDFGGGAAFTADVFELDHELRRLADETSKAESQADRTHYRYLLAIVAFLKDRYQVDLKPGQADALTIKIAEAQARKKKALLDDLRKSAESPASTASTPSDPD